MIAAPTRKRLARLREAKQHTLFQDPNDIATLLEAVDIAAELLQPRNVPFATDREAFAAYCERRNAWLKEHARDGKVLKKDKLKAGDPGPVISAKRSNYKAPVTTQKTTIETPKRAPSASEYKDGIYLIRIVGGGFYDLYVRDGRVQGCKDEDGYAIGSPDGCNLTNVTVEVWIERGGGLAVTDAKGNTTGKVMISTEPSNHKSGLQVVGWREWTAKDSSAPKLKPEPKVSRNSKAPVERKKVTL